MSEITKELIITNVYGSQEVQETLCINRSRLTALLKDGKLNPIKQLKNENLFFRPEVEQLRREMMLDSRTNLFKRLKGEKTNGMDT